MNAPDPVRIETILVNFRPKRKPACEALQAWKSLIQGLRAKGASYDTIAEILEQEGVPTSDTTVRKFCREVLLENRAKKSKRQQPSAAPQQPAGKAEYSSAPATGPSTSDGPDKLAAKPLTTVSPPNERTPGPRVARVEFIEEPKI